MLVFLRRLRELQRHVVVEQQRDAIGGDAGGRLQLRGLEMPMTEGVVRILFPGDLFQQLDALRTWVGCWT